MSKNKMIDRKAARAKTTSADGPGSRALKESTVERFPIVGLGASAGGLEALQSFFSEVSENSAMAFIVLVHLSPKQPSMMPELLQRNARIPWHLLEQSSPYAARMQHGFRFGSLGESTSALLAFAYPIHNRVDGREPLCNVAGGGLWFCSVDGGDSVLDIAATYHYFSSRKFYSEEGNRK
ncbi:MAG: chemotaxis protein CheB [Desulfobacterales bacterium]